MRRFKEGKMDPVATMAVVIAGILLLGALGDFIFARTRYWLPTVRSASWDRIFHVHAHPSGPGAFSQI